MHNRQALKHWRRHTDIKLEHRDDTDKMVAQFLINAFSECEKSPNPAPGQHSEKRTSQDLAPMSWIYF
jgi:hypothetical protein